MLDTTYIQITNDNITGLGGRWDKLISHGNSFMFTKCCVRLVLIMAKSLGN